MLLKRMVHYKCRNNKYPFTDIQRLIISDDLVPWNVENKNYNPPEYTSKSLENKPYADKNITDPSFNPKWNELDGSINRQSHEGAYKIINNVPLNLRGRTGLSGRGYLGRWGPNHAADPIVTRWKVNNGEIIKNLITMLPILQFCAIQRKDNNEWAIPGGMVDPGENVSETLKREFMEEALSSLELPQDDLIKEKEKISQFFKQGVEIYKGYVDDPRNTDNAWIETVAFNFHDESGDAVGRLSLKAGDDAKNVKWMDIDKNLELYASHEEFIKKVVELRKCHW
nr:ADP-ribose pyrophosphatase, mitochondrial [Onthophagus taurus]